MTYLQQIQDKHREANAVSSEHTIITANAIIEQLSWVHDGIMRSELTMTEISQRIYSLKLEISKL